VPSLGKTNQLNEENLPKALARENLPSLLQQINLTFKMYCMYTQYKKKQHANFICKLRESRSTYPSKILCKER
jgi:hypothetical protein